MGAYFRRQGNENRATEMLATVIAGVPQYADQLAELVGMPRADTYKVETQVSVPGCVIDLEIQASNQGTASWVLWSEHKVSAAFGEDQLLRYADALKAKAGSRPSRLIAVTLDPPIREIESQADKRDIHLLRWSDLIGIAEKAGHTLAPAPCYPMATACSPFPAARHCTYSLSSTAAPRHPESCTRRPNDTPRFYLAAAYATLTRL